ncbi:hypothetical protein [Paraburkholderia diazotrophica]|uniref:DUF4148 domain-containing protein n=1 Tax=Paraburkholderia diazotrophica TaxID=667676 RepID=A0A1H6WKY2_9BURK|nr:hypothetical protein [Paraburkholderia diazotrophica]SEJ17598.1 hypothetical protein SAMN05192539_1007163 [Paraburkholderia diazotrophica]
MKTRLIAALLVAVSAAVAAPAFASGYGPAPFYRPSVGAPASQHGVSAQTIAAERNQAVDANSAVGGVADTSSASGSRRPAEAARESNVFKGH